MASSLLQNPFVLSAIERAAIAGDKSTSDIAEVFLVAYRKKFARDCSGDLYSFHGTIWTLERTSDKIYMIVKDIISDLFRKYAEKQQLVQDTNGVGKFPSNGIWYTCSCMHIDLSECSRRHQLLQMLTILILCCR